MALMETMYTYAVRTPAMDGDYEEIDVYASNAAEARKKAIAEAVERYGEDATSEPMEPGGSGGFVIIMR